MNLVICLPTGTKVHATFAISLAAMLAATDGVKVSFVNIQSSLIAHSRNECVKDALKHEPDYILFIDSDLSFPVDSLARLAIARKDVIGCNYIMRNPPHRSLVKGDDHEGVVEVDRLPLGLMLIKADIFKKVSFPWFHTPLTADDSDVVGEDYYFCDKVVKQGISIHMEADLSKELVHWGDIGFRWTGNGYEALEQA